LPYPRRTLCAWAGIQVDPRTPAAIKRRADQILHPVQQRRLGQLPHGAVDLVGGRIKVRFGPLAAGLPGSHNVEYQKET
jgi:hypothetical protein